MLTGRYENIVEERTRPRTVHSLIIPYKPADPLQPVAPPLLALLVDTEYGSPPTSGWTGRPGFEVRVSTIGLRDPVSGLGETPSRWTTGVQVPPPPKFR